MKRKALIVILPLCIVAAALFSLAQLPQDREIEIEIGIEEEPHPDSPEEEELHGARALLLQAEKLQDEGKDTEAEIIFRQLIGSESTEMEIIASAHFGLGDCLQGQGRFEEAITEYEKVLKDYPKTEAASRLRLEIYHIGDAYNRLGRHADATSVYNRVIAEYPGTAAAGWALRELGEYQQESGNFQEAISIYKRIIEEYEGEDPEMGARDKLGEIYYLTGEYDKAISECEKVLSEPERTSGLDSVESGRLRYRLGLCYEYKQDYETALEYLKPALNYHPAELDVEDLYMLARRIRYCLERISADIDVGKAGQFQQQLQGFLATHREEFPAACERVMTKPPSIDDAIQAQYLLGRFYSDERRYSEAVQAFDKALQESEGNGFHDLHQRIFTDKVWALVSQKQYQEAVRELESFLAIDEYGNVVTTSEVQNGPYILDFAARVYDSTEDYMNCKAMYEQIIKSYPSSWEAGHAKKRLEIINPIVRSGS